MSDQTIPMMLPPALTIEELVERFVYLNNNFYEATSQAFAAPAVDASVVIPVADSLRYAVGVYLYVSGFGTVMVDSKPTLTSISIRNVDMTPAMVVPSGTPMMTCDPPFDPSVLATIPGIYDTLAQTFVAPAPGGTRDLYVTLGGWFVVGMSLFLPGLGWYTIDSIAPGDPTHCVVSYDNTTVSLGVRNRTSDSLPTGTPVFPAPQPHFIPDEVTLTATNAANEPGRAKMEVTGDLITKTVRHLDATSPRITHGIESAMAVGAGASADTLGATIVFPTTFTTVPKIFLSLGDAAAKGAGLLDFVVYASAILATGFEIRYTKSAVALTGNVIDVHWMAIGT